MSAEVQKLVLSLPGHFTNISMHQEFHANRTLPSSWKEWIAVEIEQRIPKKVADELKHTHTRTSLVVNGYPHLLILLKDLTFSYLLWKIGVARVDRSKIDQAIGNTMSW